MEYVLNCGNFGNKIEKNDKLAINRAARLRKPADLIKQLQMEGTMKWLKAKNPILRPFSWIWQGVQYMRETPAFINGFIKSKKQNKMFDALKVKRRDKGIVYYKDGKYYKKK